MNKLLCIVGPTASGKTALALQLSQEFSGDLVSADSVQVYKGLDIIAGKDLPKGTSFEGTQDRQDDKLQSFKDAKLGYYETPDKIRIYLLDVVNPKKSFSVFDFVEFANKAIHAIDNANKVPIVVGGTGFYIKALLDGMDTLHIPPNEELRRTLQSCKVLELQDLLKEKDNDKFESMNTSDGQNPRRLIRAIEIAEYMKSSNKIESKSVPDHMNILIIGLTSSIEVIKERIDKRIAERIQQGALEEARNLFKDYNHLSEQVKNANGYEELFDFLLGKVSFEESLEKWKRAEYLNAKHQMTWFKKDKRIQWFDIAEEGFEDKIFARIRKFVS